MQIRRRSLLELLALGACEVGVEQLCRSIGSSTTTVDDPQHSASLRSLHRPRYRILQWPNKAPVVQLDSEERFALGPVNQLNDRGLHLLANAGRMIQVGRYEKLIPGWPMLLLRVPYALQHNLCLEHIRDVDRVLHVCSTPYDSTKGLRVVGTAWGGFPAADFELRRVVLRDGSEPWRERLALGRAIALPV